MTPTTSGYYNFVASGIPHRLEVDTDEMARNELTVFVDCRIEDDHGELMGVVASGSRCVNCSRSSPRSSSISI